MSLSTLYLFRDVAITRDYSVVHDLTVAGWRSKLLSATSKILVSGMTVNYYRLGDNLIISLPYEDARKAAYGMLDIDTGTASKTLFFWVDSCRLVKQNIDDAGNDTVSFNISEDIWSNYSEGVYLHDTYIERRHMPRWNGTSPIYYPDAAQGVDGAYSLENSQDLTPPSTVSIGSDSHVDFRFIVVTALLADGTMKKCYGCDCIGVETSAHYDVYWNSSRSGTPSLKKIFNAEDLSDGSAFGVFGFTADFVQSITVTPYLGQIRKAATTATSGSSTVITFNRQQDQYIAPFLGNVDGSLAYLYTLNPVSELDAIEEAETVTLSPVAPVKNTSSSTYSDTDEPALYYAPARLRKVLNGTGGTVFDVPDIAAFQKEWSSKNIFDLAGAVMFVFAGTDINEANAKGAFGSMEAATLPIYSSAWKTYEAISKTGDDISYNAQQTANVIGGIVGVLSSAATAMIPGVGAAVGVLSGGSNVASTITNVYTASEDIKAKRTTIRNSPCTVVSSGSGLGAFAANLLNPVMATLKLDDISFGKLSDQYYFYGYFVNATAHGVVDLHTRETFDFIKTSGARVDGDAPGDVLEEMRSIFDRGVTIYHDYAAIGTGKVKPNREITTTAGATNA